MHVVVLNASSVLTLAHQSLAGLQPAVPALYRSGT